MAILFILAVLIVLYITRLHISYEGTAKKNPLQAIYRPEEFELSTNDFTLATEDNYKIWVSEVYTDNPKGLIIYLSGIVQPSVTYFYGHSKWMKKNGYASILLEVRGHGNSEGTLSLGYEEVKDVKAVIDYIKSQKKYEAVPIVLQGVSMGGAIAINSFGSIKEIDGLIAMSAYSSFEDAAYDIMRGYHIPSFICSIEKVLVKNILKFKFGSKVNEIRPENQIQNVGDRPALLIACKWDKGVSYANTERILKNAPQTCISWIKDSWEHFIIQDCDFRNVEEDTEYCDKILSFLKTIK